MESEREIMRKNDRKIKESEGDQGSFLTSGFQYITPILDRSWLMNITVHCDRDKDPVYIHERVEIECTFERNLKYFA